MAEKGTEIKITDSSITKMKNALWIVSIVAAVFFWFFTIYNLPPRVDRLEQTVHEHDKKLIESETKLNTILEDVKVIKAYILAQPKK